MLTTSSSLPLLIYGWLKKELSTVFEMSNTFLQYNTGAAATTFVVNAPINKYWHETVSPIKSSPCVNSQRANIVPSAHNSRKILKDHKQLEKISFTTKQKHKNDWN